MKKYIAMLAGVGTAVALVAGLPGAIGGGDDRPDVRIHEAAADYPAFSDLGALDRSSSSVVRGVVESVGAPYRVVPPGLPIDQLPAHKAAHVGVVQTDVTVKVTRTLSGADLTGERIVVSQPGGQIGDDRIVVEEEPATEKGEPYVLFLTRFPDGTFGIVGGPQGRYQVKDDKLVNLGDHTRGKGVGRQLHGLKLADLERDYRSLAAKSEEKGGPGERQEPLGPTNSTPKD